MLISTNLALSGDRYRPAIAARVAFLVVLFATVARASPPTIRPTIRLTQYSTRFYTVHTNLARKKAQAIGKHMDAVYAAYERRFRSFRPKKPNRFPLYLFKARDQYRRYLSAHGLEAGNTAGMFFVRPGGLEGLAAWVEGQTRAQLYRVLQHEGFHQFAFAYIGTELPIWVNEGLAEYFGDGILIQNKVHLGQSDADRIAFIRRIIREGKTVSFARLLEMASPEWFEAANSTNAGAAVLYNQAWSMVYFLVHGEKGRFLAAFERYLSLLGNGMSGAPAFHKAFGSHQAGPFEERWKKYALAAEPDPFSTALARMEFLGQGLRFLHQRRETPPKSVKELRERLQKIEFRLERLRYGQVMTVRAGDRSLYTVPTDTGRPGWFELRQPAKPGLPPSLTAHGVQPVPTLVWSRTADGKLVDRITFR